MADLAKLVVKLEAQTAKFQKDLAKSEKKVQRFGKTTKSSLKGITALFSGLAVGVAAKKIVDATAQQEQAFRQLEQGIKSTNNAVGFSAKELANYASELQAATTFGDEGIIAAQSQLVTFTQITGDEFNRTTEIALDMSQRFGTDVKSSILQLGKALNDPIANLSALSRAGIQFSKDQKDMIKALIESGDQVSAQKVILAELETQFGGSARAARDTFGGALQALGNNFGDLLESSGGLNDAKDSLEELNTLLTDPKTIEAANKLTSALIAGFTGAASAMTKVSEYATLIGESIAEIVGGSDDYLVRLQDKIDEVRDKLEDFSDLTEQQGELGRKSFLGIFHSLTAEQLAEYNALIEKERQLMIAFSAGADERTSTPKTTSSTVGAIAPVASAPGKLPTFDVAGQDAAEEAAKRAEQIIAETLPKIDGLRAKVLETTTLFSQGLLNEEQFQNALAMYASQIEEVANKDLTVFEEKIARMEEQFLTEYDVLAAQKEERLALLDEEIAQEALSREKLASLKLQINDKYNKDKAALDKAASRAELKTTLTVAAGVLGIMSAFAGKSFKAQKSLAIAEGIINIIGGVTKALNNPYPANIGFAAQVAAQGAGLIKTIKGTELGSVGGGANVSAGAVSSSYGTPPAVNAPQEEQGLQSETPGKHVVINIHGDLNSNHAQTTFEDLRELINEGDEVLIEADSRNGQEIAIARGGI
ncbi:MAG: hypothetical protein GY941_11430 [Planctomycetes bacterium]|nr:hypothetical protein [Planctomycetota bacterium]